MKKLLTGIIALIMASTVNAADEVKLQLQWVTQAQFAGYYVCLLYTSPSPRDRTRSRMPSSA